MEDSKSIDINYYQEAFTTPINLITLGVSAVAFVVLGFVLQYITQPIGLAAILLGLEIVLVNALATNKRFRKAIKLKKIAEIEEANKKEMRSATFVLKSLSKPLQLRYMALRKNIQLIHQNYTKLTDISSVILDTYNTKLSHIENTYLSLLSNWHKYTSYISTNKEQELASEIAKIEVEMRTDAEGVKKVKAKRVEILKKRLEKTKKATENIEIMRVQLDTIEDTVKFLYEQSVTVKDPSAMAEQIDELITETEESQDMLREINEVVGFDDSLGYNLGEENNNSSSKLKH